MPRRATITPLEQLHRQARIEHQWVELSADRHHGPTKLALRDKRDPTHTHHVILDQPTPRAIHGAAAALLRTLLARHQ